jgi:hypothetical protein
MCFVAHAAVRDAVEEALRRIVGHTPREHRRQVRSSLHGAGDAADIQFVHRPRHSVKGFADNRPES